jgi:phosphate transport system protein
MERHFDQELAELKQELLRLAALAEQSVAQALKALVQRDDILAKKVDADDVELDKLEVEIDNRCIKLLALRQPTASDLRFITVAMKISNDLERIGDGAVNIAHCAEELNKEPLLKPLVDIPHMAEMSQAMIRDTLDAFVYQRPELARQVIQRDKQVDDLNRQLQHELTSLMISNPQSVRRAFNLAKIVHCLERAADHATNIAEDVIYLYEGRDVRHQHE